MGEIAWVIGPYSNPQYNFCIMTDLRQLTIINKPVRFFVSVIMFTENVQELRIIYLFSYANSMYHICVFMHDINATCATKLISHSMYHVLFNVVPVESKTRTYHERVGTGRRTVGRK